MKKNFLCSFLVFMGLSTVGSIFPSITSNAEEVVEEQVIVDEVTDGGTISFGQKKSDSIVGGIAYKFVVEKPGVVSYSVDVAKSDYSPDWSKVLIYDTENNTYMEVDTSGGKSFSDYLNLGKGTYFFYIYGYSRVDYSFSISFEAPSDVEKEDNDSRKDATKISVNSAINGNFDKYDSVDYYKFSIDEPGKVVLDFVPKEGAKSENGLVVKFTLSDTETLMKWEWNDWTYASGEYVTAVNPLKAGDYYVSVERPYKYSGGSCYDYSLTVKYEKDNFIEGEPNDTIETATPINLDQTYYANNNGGGCAYYKLSIPTPGTYKLSASFIDEKPDTYYLPLWELYTEEGKQITYHLLDMKRKDNEASYTFETAGTYYLYCSENLYDSYYELNFMVSSPELSPIEKFITRLYNVCLDRTPDSAGLTDWVTKLQNKELAGSSAAAGFFASNEFVAKNTSDADFVEYLYLAFMDRPSDPAGKADWVTVLGQGMSRMDVCEGFAASNEFKTICQNYGIAANDMDLPNGGIRSFVTRLYRVCLDREADEAGMNNWVNMLATGQISGRQTAHGFVFSNEFTAHNYSDEEYIEHLYKAFMGRPSDANGKAYWLNSMKQGAGRDAVFNGFADSDEFSNICKKYGITRD